MHFSTAFASLAALAFSAPAVLANPYIYKPVEASRYKAGDSFTVSWRDNGEAPLSTAYGQTTVSLYTGSTTTQMELAQLGTIVDPATDTEVRITIDPTWGPDSADYFIRIQSVAGTDAAGAPLQAFSARFALSQMTGEWSSAVKAALSGSPVAAAAGTTAASAAAGMTTSVRTTAAAAAATVASLQSKVASASTSGSASASASGAQASASGTSGAARSVVVGGAVGLVGAVIALAMA
ncbi:hypothetical protein JCM10450v2_003486 [Rhodotorula kratochvilovae]